MDAKHSGIVVNLFTEKWSDASGLNCHKHLDWFSRR